MLHRNTQHNTCSDGKIANLADILFIALCHWHCGVIVSCHEHVKESVNVGLISLSDLKTTVNFIWRISS